VAAEIAVLNCLAALAQELGSLDRIAAVVKLTGYVASAEGFGEQPVVVNGASALLERVFGDAGRTPAPRSAWPNCRGARQWRSS